MRCVRMRLSLVHWCNWFTYIFFMVFLELFLLHDSISKKLLTLSIVLIKKLTKNWHETMLRHSPKESQGQWYVFHMQQLFHVKLNELEICMRGCDVWLQQHTWTHLLMVAFSDSIGSLKRSSRLSVLSSSSVLTFLSSIRSMACSWWNASVRAHHNRRPKTTVKTSGAKSVMFLFPDQFGPPRSVNKPQQML